MEKLTASVDIYSAILSRAAQAGFPSYLTLTYADWFGEIAEYYEDGTLSFGEAMEETVRVAREIYNDPDFEGDTTNYDCLLEKLEIAAPGRFRTTDG